MRPQRSAPAVITRSFRLSPHALIRVSGLPFESLDGFRSERTLDAARKADDLFGRLARGCAPLCDRLYRLISGEHDGAIRRALLNLKRCVYNHRLPGEPLSADARARVQEKDALLEADLQCWERLVDEYFDIQIFGEAAIEQDLDRIRLHLHRLWESTSVQKGVLFAQPQLYHGAEQAPSGRWDRRTENAILAYCYRAATKTSPFSTFTEVGIAHVLEGGLPPDEQLSLQAFDDTGSRTLLTASFAERVATAVRTDPALRESLPVAVSALFYRRDQIVHFLAPAPHETATTGPDDGETIRTLATTPAVDLVFDLIQADEGRRLTAVDLVRKVSEHSGVAVSRARTLVDRLIDIGLLSVQFDYPANHPRAIAGIATLLSSHPAEAVREAAGEMDNMQMLVDQLRDASASVSAPLLARIGTLASAALTRMGAASAKEAAPILVRHNVIAEDVVDVPAASLEAFKPALYRMASVLPLFDADLAERKRISDAFVRRFGADGECTNILELFEAVCEDAAQPVAHNTPPDSPGPGFQKDAIDEGRTAFIRALRHRCSGQREIALSGSFLDEWGEAASRLSPGHAPFSVTFAGQIAGGNGDLPCFVINKTLPGTAIPIAHHASDNGLPSQRWLSQTLRNWLAELDPDAEPVDLVGTFAFDGLIRPQLCASALFYPGEPRAPGQRDAIPWSDLAVVVDAQTPARLVLRRRSTNRKILPVHLGTLGSIHLPPFYRFIKSFGHILSPDWSPIDFFETLSTDGNDQIRHYGRIHHEQIVLSRETWCIPAARVPQRASGESEFGHFRRLRTWALDLGLPETVFVTPMRTNDYLRSNLPAQSFRRVHKPFFVDWNDLAGHRLFARFASLSRGVLTIAEALPNRSSLPFRVKGSRRIVEHMIELNVC